MKNKLTVLILAIFSLQSFQAFSQPAPTPYGALPSERQLKWHELDMYG
jgi:alpha-L-fucosidase